MVFDTPHTRDVFSSDKKRPLFLFGQKEDHRCTTPSLTVTLAGETSAHFCSFSSTNSLSRIARGQRPGKLDEYSRQKSIVQMDYRLTPIFARPHQSDGDAVRIGIGVEL